MQSFEKSDHLSLVGFHLNYIQIFYTADNQHAKPCMKEDGE